MRCSLLLLALAGLSLAQSAFDFAGTWVLRRDNQNILTLTLTAKAGRVSGGITKPKNLHINQDGDITGIGPAQLTLRVQKSAIRSNHLELTIDGDLFVMTLQGRDHASLVLEGMRPWTLDRVVTAAGAQLATRPVERHDSAEIRALREQLRSMVKVEQDARLALNQSRSEAADVANRPEVLRIFDRYGWVTKSLAGADAAHDFWLLVQHQTPEIQRRLLPALEKAARSGDASMSDYVYLYDRVQVGLDQPQRWGTQVKCEGGKPVLSPVEDAAGLDARRKELFLVPIRDYLASDYLVKLCAASAK